MAAASEGAVVKTEEIVVTEVTEEEMEVEEEEVEIQISLIQEEPDIHQTHLGTAVKPIGYTQRLPGNVSRQQHVH